MTNRLTRRDLLLSSASLALLGVRGAGQPRATRSNPPNILVILADDMGYADLSIYGCRDYQTPVLDRLAREGLMMTSGHANSAVCSATRFAMITGRYQYRIPSGLFEPGNGGPDYGIPAGHPTLPSLMRLQGYRTSLFGKWHLGGAAQYLPTSKGHDYFFGFLGGATDYFRVGGGRGTGRGGGDDAAAPGCGEAGVGRRAGGPDGPGGRGPGAASSKPSARPSSRFRIAPC